jgi:hypothetical protein
LRDRAEPCFASQSSHLPGRRNRRHVRSRF